MVDGQHALATDLEFSPVMRCKQALLLAVQTAGPCKQPATLLFSIWLASLWTLLCSQHRRADSLQYDSSQCGKLSRQCWHAPATGLNALTGCGHAAQSCVEWKLYTWPTLHASPTPSEQTPSVIVNNCSRNGIWAAKMGKYGAERHQQAGGMV